MRANAQVRIHRAHGLQNIRVVAQAPAGARSDLFDLGRDLGAGSTVVLHFARPLHGVGKQRGDFVQFGRALGANVDLGARMRRDGIDARSAFDDSEVVGRPRAAVAGQALFGESGDGAR